MLSKLRQLLNEQKQLKISVHVTPKSRGNQLTKLELGTNQEILLSVKIKGQPEKGLVNDNLIRFLSQSMDLPPSCIKIISGRTSRHKILALSTNAL